LLKHVNSK